MSDAKKTAAEMIREQCGDEDEWIGKFREEYDHETEIPSEYSRQYESKSVAKKLDNGVWVGFTYWFGGGKHSEPKAIDWVDDAYFLNVEEVMEPVLKFTKIEG